MKENAELRSVGGSRDIRGQEEREGYRVSEAVQLITAL